MKKLLILISLSLLALSGNAFADPDNYTAMSGTGCDNYFAGDTGKFNHQNNGITNVGVGSRWVSCPINKDNVGSTLGTSSMWIRWNGTAGTTMTCYLNSFDVNGNLGQQISVGPFGPGWGNIAGLTFDDFWGNNELFCLVPQGGTLQTIHYFEN